MQLLVKDFAVEAAEFEELDADAGLPPQAVAAANAAGKADAVAAKHPEDWVLGADTIVVLDGRIYGKPRDLAEARSFLQAFSGRCHECMTAVAIRQKKSNKKIDFVAISQVRFHKLDDRVIDEYLAKVPVLDKAGAYGIQEYGNMLVESIDGELENIIGLPVAALKERLHASAVDWSEFNRGDFKSPFEFTNNQEQ